MYSSIPRIGHKGGTTSYFPLLLHTVLRRSVHGIDPDYWRTAVHSSNACVLPVVLRDHVVIDPFALLQVTTMW